MFTQSFGSYLLNNRLVSHQQLIKALELQSKAHVRLGVLAINAGLLTSEQVDELHGRQETQDIRTGDLAVSLGYLTSEQVNELLSSQRKGYLLLGQALVDIGALTNGQLQIALAAYKGATRISESEIGDERLADARRVISDYYHFDLLPNPDFFSDYVSLLLKNVIRFIGDDFTLLPSSVITELRGEETAYQHVSGGGTLFSAVTADRDTFCGVASRYAKELFHELNDYARAAMGEFLNLHNGLFAVNISNSLAYELTLSPQVVVSGGVLAGFSLAFDIAIGFPFGTVHFILSPDTPAGFEQQP